MSSAHCPRRRRRRPAWPVALAILLSLLSCRHMLDPAPVAQADGAGPPGKRFLWTISSPTATVHLLGSIHVASRDLYPLPAAIESAFERSAVLVLELPIDAAAQREAAQKLAAAGTYPPGEGLEQHLDPGLLARLQHHLARTGTPVAGIRRLRPWLLSTGVLLAEMQRLGYHPSLGIDRYFAQKAGDRKRVLALETVDEQVGLLAGLSEAAQEAMLRETLGGLDQLEPQLRAAVAAWQTGDLERMEALLIAPTRTHAPELFRRLFTERNARMAASIAACLRTGGEYFVIVGAGHLAGPGGILDHLRAKGYRPIQQE